MLKTINKSNIEKVLALLFGIFMGTNIIYVFSVGNTHFVISEVYSVLLFLILIILKKVNLKACFRIIPISFKLFMVSILLSCISVIVTFWRIGLLYRYTVGLIALAISITAMINIIVLFDYRKYIALGLGIGIVLNIVFSAFQYIAFQNGVVYTFLYDMFVQDSFHLSVYNFAAQGLFLEPSHMMHFLVVAVPIWFVWFFKNKISDFLFILLLITMCAMSGAGTSVVVFLVIALLFLKKLMLNNRRIIVKRSTVLKWTIAITITFIAFVMIGYQTDIFSDLAGEIGHYLNLAVEGSNVNDVSNTERLTSMKTAISLIPSNPIGCGWNMVHTLLEEKTLLGTATAFSDIIEMTLEVGILGISFYLVFMLSLIKKCYFMRNTECNGIAIALFATLILQVLGDNSFNALIFMTIGWGMGLIKKEKVDYIINKNKN